MTDPRNIAHDKRVKRQKKYAVDPGSEAMHYRPGKKPHQIRQPIGHGPDSDEPIDQTENPVEQQH
jgi:hypothetical protein